MTWDIFYMKDSSDISRPISRPNRQTFSANLHNYQQQLNIYFYVCLPFPTLPASTVCAWLLAACVLLCRNPLRIKNEIYEARKECVRGIVLKGFLIRCGDLWRI